MCATKCQSNGITKCYEYYVINNKEEQEILVKSAGLLATRVAQFDDEATTKCAATYEEG